MSCSRCLVFRVLTSDLAFGFGFGFRFRFSVSAFGFRFRFSVLGFGFRFRFRLFRMFMSCSRCLGFGFGALL